MVFASYLGPQATEQRNWLDYKQFRTVEFPAQDPSFSCIRTGESFRGTGTVPPCGTVPGFVLAPQTGDSPKQRDSPQQRSPQRRPALFTCQARTLSAVPLPLGPKIASCLRLVSGRSGLAACEFADRPDVVAEALSHRWTSHPPGTIGVTHT